MLVTTSALLHRMLRLHLQRRALDAGDYALFIKTTWWEHEKVHYPSADVAPEGAVEKTRMGIRYNQLLAFIISAL